MGTEQYEEGTAQGWCSIGWSLYLKGILQIHHIVLVCVKLGVMHTME